MRCESSLGFESVIAIAEKYGDGVAACTVKTVGGDKVEFAIAINVGSGNALGFGARGKEVCVLKVPSPTLRRVLVLLLKRLAVMISVKPSALIRPLVIACGPEDAPVE